VFVDWGNALWGVGAVDIVNLLVCQPSAFDVTGEAAVWSAFAEGLGVPLDQEFRRASHIAHTVATLLIDKAVAESIGKPPQWLRGLVPGFHRLLSQFHEYGR
jgi:hypothetical protein